MRSQLESCVSSAHDGALERVELAIRDGALLRGEVLARWQDVVGTGEFLRRLESRVGRIRDRVVAAVTGRSTPVEELGSALETGIAAVVVAAVEDAAEQSYGCWARHEAGARLLTDELARPAPGLAEAVERLVRDWEEFVLGLVRTEGASKRSGARLASYGVNGAGLVVMLAVFSQTGGLTGAEVAVAGGTSVASQKVLEAIFGEQAVRGLARQARDELLARAGELLDRDAGRYRHVLDSASSMVSGDELRQAADRVAAVLAVTLTDRLAALSSVAALGAGRLPEEVLADLRGLDQRAGTRLRLSGEYTVVALAGATGSGKSSLFNAIAGESLATVGVRRPTTSATQAVVFGPDGAKELLDWLEIGNRQYGDASSAPELSGLVLLDLPDHDSVELSHRAEVDRLVRLVDAFVWVLDPQKYADALLHDTYLRPLATHRDVMVVVLNQSDRLADDDLAACMRDLDHLLADDGIGRRAGALDVGGDAGRCGAAARVPGVDRGRPPGADCAGQCGSGLDGCSARAAGSSAAIGARAARGRATNADRTRRGRRRACSGRRRRPGI